MKNLKRLSTFLFAIVAIFFVSNFINSGIVLASVDKIVFKNEPQTIGVGVKSALYQIQIQNSSGELEVAPFTIYFTLPLELGDFTSQTGTVITAASSVYIATGASNKYFYFVSNTEGSYVMKVTATNKDKTLSWEAEQTVVVNSGATGGGTVTTTATTTDGVATTTATTTTTNTVSTNSGGGSTVYSVHYIQEDLSNYEPTNVFEVSAGRNRLAYLDLPINFEAKHKVSKDLENRSCNYVWNFGDGASLSGEKVQHIYKYVGDYNLVLNGTCGNLKSVSRTSIKVVTSNISISSKVDGSVEIYNQGKYEINLYDWKLKSTNQEYTFPLDTIISAGEKVTFPAGHLKLQTLGNVISLFDSANKSIAQINSLPMVVGLNISGTVARADWEKFAAEYWRLTRVNYPALPLAVNPDLSRSATSSLESTDPDSDVPLVAAVATAPGFWGKLFHPIRTIQESFYK